MRIRDWFWLVLVVGLVITIVKPTDPDYIMCPCCGSMYDLDDMRQLADNQ